MATHARALLTQRDYLREDTSPLEQWLRASTGHHSSGRKPRVANGGDACQFDVFTAVIYCSFGAPSGCCGLSPSTQCLTSFAVVQRCFPLVTGAQSQTFQKLKHGNWTAVVRTTTLTRFYGARQTMQGTRVIHANRNGRNSTSSFRNRLNPV